MYFTLKDEKARIQAVMFASYNRSLKFMPENGMNVLVTGDVTVYEPSGQYQIYVTAMQPDGIGDLYLAFEQLKEKLEKEGYFSPQYKKQIPQISAEYRCGHFSHRSGHPRYHFNDQKKISDRQYFYFSGPCTRGTSPSIDCESYPRGE